MQRKKTKTTANIIINDLTVKNEEDFENDANLETFHNSEGMFINIITKKMNFKPLNICDLYRICKRLHFQLH